MGWRGKSSSHYAGDKVGSSDLDTELCMSTGLSKKAQKEFLKACWNIEVDNDGELERYQAVIRHYDQCCAKVAIKSAISTFAHKIICSVVQEISIGIRVTCESAIKKKLPSGSTDAAATECVNFVAQSILFIDTTFWTSTETLAEFVARTFAAKSVEDNDFRIPASFNARTFSKVAGLNVQWTLKLGSHLDITGDDANIALFSCPTVLELYEESNLKSIFPPGFIAETRKTMSMMLPTSRTKSRKWLEQEQVQVSLDKACLTCPFLKASERHTRNFEYWKDRIIVAKEVFDDHQPRGLMQFLRDDRNSVQYWTFWVAATAFMLTLIACIEGALQVYKAYHPTT